MKRSNVKKALVLSGIMYVGKKIINHCKKINEERKKW
jgi:hypothetical protein